MELLISWDKGSETFSSYFQYFHKDNARIYAFPGVKWAYQITDFIGMCKAYGKVF